LKKIGKMGFQEKMGKKMENLAKWVAGGGWVDRREAGSGTLRWWGKRLVEVVLVVIWMLGRM
jgi:hypothetical protein